MQQSELTRLATEAKLARAEKWRYLITWRGNAHTEELLGTAGLKEISDRLKLTYGSVGNYLCRGKGSFERAATNPITQELDVMRITRIGPPAPPAKRRGRPPKQYDWARLGEEAKSVKGL